MEHPFSQFKYCPKCGSVHFEINNEKSKRCADCEFVYYFNPSAATVALIMNERNELLVCRRARSERRNRNGSEKGGIFILFAQYICVFRFHRPYSGFILPLYSN